MVGYSDDDDALTLGNDDRLRIGDYSVFYSDNNDRWNIRYEPTEEDAFVPRSESGSLFPTDFADALAGQALADDGNLYSSVQTAENNATNWMFIGPGTFSETLNVNNGGFTVWGSGYGTHIDGGNSPAVGVDADDVTLENFSVSTMSNQADAVTTTSASNRTFAHDIHIRTAHGAAINFSGHDPVIMNCVVEEAMVGDPGNNDSFIVSGAGTGAVIENCILLHQSSNPRDGIDLNGRNDAVVRNCFVQNCQRGGILLDNDSVAIGCQVRNCSLENTGAFGGLRTDGVDSIIANCRVDSTQSGGINDQGTGTVLDDNLVADPN